MTRFPLPWIVTALSLLAGSAGVAFGLRSASVAEPPAAGRVSCDPADLGRLQRQLVATENDAKALRGELDRMRVLVGMKKVADQKKAERGEDKLSDEQKRERLTKALADVKELMPRLASGEKEAYAGMREVIFALAGAPPDAAAQIRQAYEETQDPATRRLLLPHILSRDSVNGRAFLFDQLAQAKDPDLRADLLMDLEYVTDLPSDSEAQQTLLSAVTSADSSPRARQMAVEELAKARSPEADQALAGVAAGDYEPATREAAIRALAARPETRAQMLELAGKEPDERLRTIGECTARLSALGVQ